VTRVRVKYWVRVSANPSSPNQVSFGILYSYGQLKSISVAGGEGWLQIASPFFSVRTSSERFLLTIEDYQGAAGRMVELDDVQFEVCP
jgi:hypothetical protein